MKKLKNLLQYKYLYYTLMIITFFYIIIYINNYKHQYRYKLEENIFEVEIVNYYIDSDKLSIELKGKEKIIGTYYFGDEEESELFKRTYFIKDNVKIKGKLSYPKNNTIPNTFNYKKYLLYKDIHYLIMIDDIQKINSSNNILIKIKNYIYKRIDNIKNNEYLYAFILGNSKYLSNEISNSYKINTITHLFALSGLHVSVFASIINKLLKKLSTKKRLFITMMFLVFLCFITSYTPSIIRASIFYFLINLNKILKMNIQNKYLLFVTFIIMVFINPFYIYNLGFVLSFTITYFLLLCNENIKIKNKLLSLLFTSFIAMISSLPIITNNFYSINIIGFINNLFFIPYVSNIVYPFSLLTILFPSLSSILNILTDVMEYISNISSDILNINIIFPKFSVIIVCAYYILLIILIKHKRIIIYVLFISLLIFQYNIKYFDKSTQVSFIDVGQGDSTLIKTKNNKYVLIDTGGKLKYETEIKRNKTFNLMTDSIIPFFNSKGVKKIDYLIITHGDYDHMGEAINLVENFKVEKVIFNCGEYNDLEKELIKVLEKKKISYYSCIKELNIDYNKLYFLNNKDYGNENDNSSVVYTELNNYKFLFMGDAGVEVEEDLIKKYNLQNIDILKVGHHGSKTSSGKPFIDEINPKYSIISVGKNNRYGHPNDSVLGNLNNSKIYRTDQDGSIMFKIKNNKLKIVMCSP